jgi:hypothetical protein
MRGRQRGQSAMTTVETLIAIGISVILLTQVCALWYYSSRSFAAQAAYTALDQDSQRALDRLSKEIRQAKAVRAYSPTWVRLEDFDNGTLEFGLSGRSLTRIKTVGGTTERSTILNNVDTLGFSMFQKVPKPGEWDQFSTTNVATCKLLEVHWRCSRKLHPLSPNTTEYMQSAKIVIRSK